MTKNKLKAFYSLFILVLAGIIALFSSCGEETYSVLIKNESSKVVSYVYNDEPSFSINPGDEKRYTVSPFTQPPKNIDTNGPMSIKMIARGDIFSFVNIEDGETITIVVYNELPMDIILISDKYVNFNDSTNMKILANSQETAKLYTTKSLFEKTVKIYTDNTMLSVPSQQFTISCGDLSDDRKMSVFIRRQY